MKKETAKRSTSGRVVGRSHSGYRESKDLFLIIHSHSTETSDMATNNTNKIK